MKRIQYLFLVLLLGLTACNDKDALWNVIDDMDGRITTLETICEQMNTNIESIQTLIEAQESGDVITNITEIRSGSTVIGYTITFKNSDPITIYNGTNGKDGADGESHTIGIEQDRDNKYYWTLDGTWLLDSNGSKLQVTGENGSAPQMKIVDGNWYISYDGSNWTCIGQATGDSMFSSVTQDDNYVYFTLVDNSVIKIVKGTTLIADTKYVIVYNANGGVGTMTPDSVWYQKTAIIKSCIYSYTQRRFKSWNTKADGTGTPFVVGETIVVSQNITLYAQWEYGSLAEFSVSSTNKVSFSMGNLQYHPKNKEWRFAEHQYDYVGSANNNISNSYDGWVDLFGWGTGNNPTNTSTEYYSPYTTNTYNDYSTFVDWGVNLIGTYPANTWRTPTYSEWKYLLNKRTNASSLYSLASISNGTITINGLILLPDNWSCPNGITLNVGNTSFANNVFDISQWSQLESAGAIFLPTTGKRNETIVNSGSGDYWTSTAYDSEYAYALHFNNSGFTIENRTDRYYGLSVRLIRNL